MPARAVTDADPADTPDYVPSSTMIEVVVARGHTLVEGPVNRFGRGTNRGPGETAKVPENEIPRLVRLGVILAPQTGDAPGYETPPPIEGQPKIEITKAEA